MTENILAAGDVSLPPVLFRGGGMFHLSGSENRTNLTSFLRRLLHISTRKNR